MAKSLNSVSFTGYLGGDPRIHTFDDGSMVANLSLAVSRSKKQDGEFVDDTIWVDVKVNAYADRTGAVEAIETYLRKGSFVCVSGQLAQPREWEDKEGNTRFTIVVDHAAVTFGPKVDDAPQKQAPAQQAQQRTAAPAASKIADDDLPF